MKNKPTTFLTDRFFLLFGTVNLLGVFSIFYPFLLIPYAALIGGFALISVYDQRTLHRPGGISPFWVIPPLIELGSRVNILLQWDHPGDDLARITCCAPLLPQLRFDEIQMAPILRDQDGTLRALTTLSGHCSELGYFNLDQVELHSGSLLGFWFRKIILRTRPSECRAIPSRREIPEQKFHEMISTQRVLTQGSRRLIRNQAQDQFHSIREYQSGDSFTRVDAKKSARYGKFMLKTFDGIFEHRLVIGLDVGRSLTGELSGSMKSDYYLAAALTLAKNAIHSRDQVAFFAFSDEIHCLIPPTRHFESFYPLYRGEEKLKPREVETDFSLVEAALRQLAGPRSIFLLLTDFSKPSAWEALTSGMSSAFQKHLCVLLGVQEERFTLDSLVMKYRGEALSSDTYSHFIYNYWIEDSLQQLRTRINSSGAGAVFVTEAYWLSAINRVYGLLRESVRI